MNNKMEQLPPSDNSKAAGIRGLKQIMTVAKGTLKYHNRVELLERYLAKFVNRMNKLLYDPDLGIWYYPNDPINLREETLLKAELMEIIKKTPAEEKEDAT